MHARRELLHGRERVVTDVNRDIAGRSLNLHIAANKSPCILAAATELDPLADIGNVVCPVIVIHILEQVGHVS